MNRLEKNEEELDKLHESVMENLYKIFEYEFNAYFRLEEASIDILGIGINAFPFDTSYDNALPHIEKSLEVIEKNILDHITQQIKIIYKEKKNKKTYINIDSEKQKEKLSLKIREAIEKMEF